MHLETVVFEGVNLKVVESLSGDDIVGMDIELLSQS